MKPTRELETREIQLFHNFSLTLDQPNRSFVKELNRSSDSIYDISKSESKSIKLILMKDLSFFVETISDSRYNIQLDHRKSYDDLLPLLETYGSFKYSVIQRETNTSPQNFVISNFTLDDLLEAHGGDIPKNLKACFLHYKYHFYNFISTYFDLHRISEEKRWWPEGVFTFDHKTFYNERQTIINWLSDMRINSNDYRINRFSIDFNHKEDYLKFKLAFNEFKYPSIHKEQWETFVDQLYIRYRSPIDLDSYCREMNQ